jgi:fatty acid desaturase
MTTFKYGGSVQIRRATHFQSPAAGHNKKTKIDPPTRGFARMATAVAAPTSLLQEPELKARLQQFRRPDNLTNWYYLLRSYLLLGLVIGGSSWFFLHRAELGLHWAWGIPVAAVAIVLIGVGQHQLTVLAHEASHHTLFKNKLLNELVSDWCCMFPMLSTTHHYRLHHLAHHQFVNDPQRDPNVPQVWVNGHWRHFPMTRGEFWRELGKQIWPLNLIRYLRTQAKSNSMAGVRSPYERSTIDRSKMEFALRVGLFYLLGLSVASIGLVILGNPLLLAAVPPVAYVAAIAFFALIPDSWYLQHRVHPTYTMRTITLMRITFMTVIIVGIAWLSYFYGPFAFYLFVLLWLIPMLTSFSLFMMLRQVVQHSNSDRGWLTNTRIFLVNLFVRDSILPYGQDIHLPHHMFATVPHYRLRKLHDYLMQYPEYREEAIVVRGAVLPRHDEHPSILDVLGPDWSKQDSAVFIDDSVLEGERVEERAEIQRESEESQRDAI